jgi:hypothetical protein
VGNCAETSDSAERSRINKLFQRSKRSSQIAPSRGEIGGAVVPLTRPQVTEGIEVAPYHRRKGHTVPQPAQYKVTEPQPSKVKPCQRSQGRNHQRSQAHTGHSGHSGHSGHTVTEAVASQRQNPSRGHKVITAHRRRRSHRPRGSSRPNLQDRNSAQVARCCAASDHAGYRSHWSHR